MSALANTSGSMPIWTPQRIRQRIQELGRWFHNIRLDGIETAPDHFLGDYPNVKWQRFAHVVPSDLSGRSVLDIGCNAGFYSMEMAKRGAKRVLGIDHDDDYLNQGRFAAEVSGLNVEFRKLSVYDLADLDEQFDLVIFMGVLYHLRHPLLALDLIHGHVTGPGSLLLFQSMQRGSRQVEEIEDDYLFEQAEQFDQPGYPKLHFVEKWYCGDETNWWIPNRACAEAMLRSAGFEILQHPEDEVYLCRWQPLPEHAGDPYVVYPSRGKKREESRG